ncbi:MAG: four helix bundle protein [Candidatus Marinimicrobia bacterium]|jgi:four helix bundle protein|uniref:TIGR02436 family protein n=1 Tax=uncultured bacterium FPPZ_5C6 TaxID=1343849 RepID=S4W5K2_9BACT|nr:TIGR02436 family protein [uncultured bacterium FPPZ_5C6]MBT3478729.1 four helix bundle protein [Candidatus Neomarinimicrobiota bacterium]MBT3676392.1 four helix bundle protein [Candidatus Neomarinimicrobiota bacterium]MBT3763247.1 four helix bundle protein [Candidatus Neomarinimicrobiota bacterium]MBT4069218.1 four helix bundle protein [Candidatus Neomarinimicrobiota bacterium]
MKKNIIKDKSFDFAIRIVKLYQYLTTEKNEYVLSKQLLRSGTSVGAMVRESEHAESKADFIHKLAIAQKESNETLYWLELLNRTDYLKVSEFESINNDVTEIIKLLTSIIITTKKG